jgi:hypothetical protein
MGRSRYKVLKEAYPYFHTLTVAGWQPVFTRRNASTYFLIALSGYRQAELADRHSQVGTWERENFFVDRFLLN